MPVMSIILLSSGVLLCFLGLLGFSVVMYFGFRLRNQPETNYKDEKKNNFEQLIIVNYLALCLSAFGLIILVLGIFLS